jgi:hypothetical protein
MNDIVIDTNVLAHTNNKNNHFNRSSIGALEIIKKQDLFICFDDVFNVDESKNTSVIGHEYIKHIRVGTFAYAFLLDRITKGRVVQINKKDFLSVKRDLNKKIISKEMEKPHDIVFIMVACGSNNKLLVSNDCNDFTKGIREYVYKKFFVSIIDSDEYVLNQSTLTKQEKHTKSKTNSIK